MSIIIGIMCGISFFLGSLFSFVYCEWYEKTHKDMNI